MDAQKEYDQIVRQEGFNAGAHQDMQETRLEIALNLIKQVMMEESGPSADTNSKLLVLNLLDVSKDLSSTINAFRNRSR